MSSDVKSDISARPTSKAYSTIRAGSNQKTPGINVPKNKIKKKSKLSNQLNLKPYITVSNPSKTYFIMFKCIDSRKLVSFNFLKKSILEARYQLTTVPLGIFKGFT